MTWLVALASYFDSGDEGVPCLPQHWPFCQIYSYEKQGGENGGGNGGGMDSKSAPNNWKRSRGSGSNGGSDGDNDGYRGGNRSGCSGGSGSGVTTEHRTPGKKCERCGISGHTKT